MNHEPTPTEPETLPWGVPAWFLGQCNIRFLEHYEIGSAHDLYGQLQKDDRFNVMDRTNRPAWLAMRAERVDDPFAPWRWARREDR